MAKKTSTRSKTEVTVTAAENTSSSLCCCGCGEQLAKGRTFRQGHDARFHGRITKLKDGRLTWVDVVALIEEYAIPNYEAKFEKAPAAKPVRKPRAIRIVKSKPKVEADASIETAADTE